MRSLVSKHCNSFTLNNALFTFWFLKSKVLIVVGYAADQLLDIQTSDKLKEKPLIPK